MGGEILFSGGGPDDPPQIWRIGDDRKPPSQVTATESGAYRPALAPDGTWFAYTLIGPGPAGGGVWRQPAGGGDPVLLDADATGASISPDGAHIAISVWRVDDQGNYSHSLEVIPAAGGEPVISIDGYSMYGPSWRPDGQAFSFTIEDQVWLQLLDGSPPEQLTHFGNDRTVSHAWSPDGKWLYLVSEKDTRDAVLIRNF